MPRAKSTDPLLTDRLHLVVSPEMRERIAVRASQLRISDSELVRRFIDQGLGGVVISDDVYEHRVRTAPREPLRRDVVGA